MHRSSEFVVNWMMVVTKLDFQVMGDRMGNIRWWDVTTGHSSSFNTHRDGIRRIKFSPVVQGDHSRGRIAVLFYDNTFSVFDLVSKEVGFFLIISALSQLVMINFIT